MNAKKNLDILPLIFLVIFILILVDHNTTTYLDLISILAQSFIQSIDVIATLSRRSWSPDAFKIAIQNSTDGLIRGKYIF